jgi:hypothetical protein
MGRFTFDQPAAGFALRGHKTRAGQNVGAMRRRIRRIQDDETRVIDPAIGKFKRALEFRRERFAGFVALKIDPARRRQKFSSAD